VTDHSRRAVLGAAACGAAGSLSGCSLFEAEDDGTATAVSGERARTLADRFAPAIYFDTDERWFPTDPRQFESDRDGETVVDGFDALNGYVEAGGHTDPPQPRVFYRVLEYDASPLAVVQYWVYSAFDQFTTNFHWHDWELLQVFLDTDSGDPQLYVASSHSRSVPNNEHLDPETDRRPRVLSELGSHSSGLSVNDDADSFQRLAVGDGLADITNSLLEGVENVASIPLAYGLPRDEGFRLPFAVPELDGDPVYDHDRLPSVTAEDLVPAELTVRSFDDLRSPPTDLPERSTGYQFEHEARSDTDADITYELVPSSELEHIAEFTGPQLSFEFAIPDAVEDRIAGHITTTGVPWDSDRYDNPASDITENRHRQAFADRYEAIGDASPVSQVIAGVTEAVPDGDAPDGEGLTTAEATVEVFALLQSDPVAVPTFNGIAAVRDVSEGEHTLTVNGAGVAPHSEQVTVAEGDQQTLAGVGGEIPTVAREQAVKVAVDPSEADSDLGAFAVEDDFAGRLYDSALSGTDAVYVHRGGAFTAEVRDTDDEVGAFRVNPGEESLIRIDEPRTGVTPLAEYLADVAAETRDEIAAAAAELDVEDGDDDTGGPDGGGAVRGLVNALDAVAAAAERTAEDAAAGNRRAVENRLASVANRLENVRTRLSEARGSIPEELARAVENRLEQSRRRREQAAAAETL
jgi:hypothetical protein